MNDQLHSYFLHSTIQFENDEATDDINATSGRGRQRRGLLRENDEATNATTSQSKQEENPKKQSVTSTSQYVGKRGLFTHSTSLYHITPTPRTSSKSEDEEWLEELDNADSEDQRYKLLVEKMGIFRWQSAHGFRAGQNRGLLHLKPTFMNVKEYVTSN